MSIRLPERVGLAAAKRLMFTSGQVSATEALALGRVDQVAPDAQLDEAVDSLASQISANSPHANRIIKSLLRDGTSSRAHRRSRTSARCPTGVPPTSKSDSPSGRPGRKAAGQRAHQAPGNPRLVILHP
jgi:enoyl-CoA hydratase/carnithine racemase